MKTTTMKDGHGITLSIAGHDFSLVLDPTEITPPGIEGGDPIENTTLSNTAVTTKVPPALKKITDGKLTVTYNPGEQADIDSAIGDNAAITITFPDAGDATLVFYGYLKEFTPGELKKGELPTAECSFVATNDNAGVETAPILTP